VGRWRRANVRARGRRGPPAPASIPGAVLARAFGRESAILGLGRVAGVVRGRSRAGARARGGAPNADLAARAARPHAPNHPAPPRSYNTWQLLEAAAGVKGSPADVKAQLDKAAAAKLNVVRAFAFGTTEGFGLQTKPGEYNEAAFKALDTVIDEAGKRGLRLILAIANNWDDANTDEKRRAGANTDNKFAYANAVGKLDFVYGKPVGEDAFFTDEKAKKLFKAHIDALVNRVNTVNGKKVRGEEGGGGRGTRGAVEIGQKHDQRPPPPLPRLVSTRTTRPSWPGT